MMSASFEVLAASMSKKKKTGSLTDILIYKIQRLRIYKDSKRVHSVKLQRCQIKFPNIHVRLLEMFTKSSRIQFEDRKLSETVGIRRKLSVRNTGTEEINTKKQERELLFIFKFVVTILNNGSSLISSESSVSESQQSLFFSAILGFIFCKQQNGDECRKCKKGGKMIIIMYINYTTKRVLKIPNLSFLVLKSTYNTLLINIEELHG